MNNNIVVSIVKILPKVIIMITIALLQLLLLRIHMTTAILFGSLMIRKENTQETLIIAALLSLIIDPIKLYPLGSYVTAICLVSIPILLIANALKIKDISDIESTLLFVTVVLVVSIGAYIVSVGLDAINSKIFFNWIDLAQTVIFTTIYMGYMRLVQKKDRFILR